MVSSQPLFEWHEFLCHSYFSFLQGASAPGDYIARASELGYSGLGFTDMDGVYGIARAYRQRKQLELKLPLYYGAEIHFSQDHDLPLIYQDTLALLALNPKGYHKLCEILSFAHREGKSNAYVPLENLLSFDLDGIVAILPMRGKIRCLDPSATSIEPDLRTLSEAFQGRFYMAVSRYKHPLEDQWIPTTLEMSKKLNLPLLLSQDAFFHCPSQKPVSDMMHGIRTNKSLDEIPEHLFVNSGRCLQSKETLLALYHKIPGFEAALVNAKELAEKFSFDLDCLRYRYPKEMIPQGLSAQEYLEEETWKGAKQHFGDPIPEKTKALLIQELELIAKLEFADFFLTVFDIVRWARQQSILCQGRGSAANSAVCFTLGITSVNPTHFDLLFERFINVERGDPPDIDVDFEHERREEVIQYIYKRYGRDKAAMVANVITFKTKGAMRFSGKALGLPDALLDAAADTKQTKLHRGNGPQGIIAIVKERHNNTFTISPHLWELWAACAEAILGFPRHLGIHSGGFILSDKNITRLCHQEPATMENRSVVCWCKEDIEGLNFFKIDVLSLGGLTLIRKAFDLIKTHYGPSLTMANIPQNDPDTYTMIQNADTVGTFQIESRAQMSFLPRHKPLHFYDLVVQVAIIRPGPIQGGMIHPYLRRRSGLEKVSYPDPRLEPILKRTFGVPIFQEQVMRVAMEVGGFSPGEADELRRNIGVFGMSNAPKNWVGKLVDGMRERGIEETFIETIMGHIRGFASYGFPESHAASFALIAYATSYLKCHYPTAFFCAILNAQPMGFYTPDVLIKTAQQCGVGFLPFCIRDSDWDHKIENGPNGEKQVRLGFRLIKSLNKKAIQSYVQRRNSGTHRGFDTALGCWPTLESMLQENVLARTDLTSLAAANTFQVYGIHRRAALWLAEAAPYAELLEPPDTPVLFPKESLFDEVQVDYRATSTSLGPHPSLLMKDHAWDFVIATNQLTPADQVKTKRMAGQQIHVFGMITCRQAPPSAKGMMFLTLWDENGSFDLVFRPTIYEKFQPLIDGQAFLCVSGVVQNNEDAYSILVSEVHGPQTPKATLLPMKKARPLNQDLSPSLPKARSYM